MIVKWKEEHKLCGIGSVQFYIYVSIIFSRLIHPLLVFNGFSGNLNIGAPILLVEKILQPQTAQDLPIFVKLSKQLIKETFCASANDYDVISSCRLWGRVGGGGGSGGGGCVSNVLFWLLQSYRVSFCFMCFIS